MRSLTPIGISFVLFTSAFMGVATARAEDKKEIVALVLSTCKKTIEVKDVSGDNVKACVPGAKITVAGCEITCTKKPDTGY